MSPPGGQGEGRGHKSHRKKVTGRTKSLSCGQEVTWKGILGKRSSTGKGREVVGNSEGGLPCGVGAEDWEPGEPG